MKELVDVLFEDESILVLNKPCALLTTAPPGIDNLVARAKDYIRWRDHRGPDVYMGIVHRLDRPASGAIVLGLSSLVTRKLSDQFQLRSVAKEYLAAVEKPLADKSGEWTDMMRKIPDQARGEMVDSEHPDAKKAQLTFEVTQQTSEASLLRIQLMTGRTHQIRLQSAHRGHPVIGDFEYGGKTPFGPAAENPRDQHIALHARSLTIKHPTTSEVQTFLAPLSLSWQELGFELPA